MTTTGMPDFAADDRLDPRVQRVLPLLSSAEPTADAADRDEILARANSPEAMALYELTQQLVEATDREEVVPQAGIITERLTFTSSPDGNEIPVQVFRPESTESTESTEGQALPAVYYLHGGGMMTLSAFQGNYRAWGKMLAHRGVAVFMPDFRNALVASESGDVAPYPAGLNDAVSGLRWLLDHADELGIDPARVVVSGESGGGNLTLALGLRLVADGEAHRVKGLYAFCPYLAGMWPRDDLQAGPPSSERNEGYFLRLHSNVGRVAYGIDAFEAGDPQAWPLFAQTDDLRGFPPTIISVNECDPLHDDGVAFYRKLLAADVSARCRTIHGTMHAIEVIPNVCGEISRDAARDVAALAIEELG